MSYNFCDFSRVLLVGNEIYIVDGHNRKRNSKARSKQSLFATVVYIFIASKNIIRIRN